MVRSFPSLFRFTATLLAFGFSATTAGAWYWAEAKLCRDQILDPDSPIVCDSEIHTVPYRALYQRYRLDAGLPGDFNEFKTLELAVDTADDQTRVYIKSVRVRAYRGEAYGRWLTLVGRPLWYDKDYHQLIRFPDTEKQETYTLIPDENRLRWRALGRPKAIWLDPLK